MYNPSKDSNGLPKRGKQFEAVQLNNIKRNMFNMSHDTRGSYNFGWLYPVDFLEVLPGDTWNVKRSVIAKAAPMVAPMYHQVQIYFHSFFVPSRLLWANYKKMRSPGDGTVSMASSLTYTPPSVPSWNLSQSYSIWSDDEPTLATLSTHYHLRLLDELGLPSPIRYSLSANGAINATLDGNLYENIDVELSILPLRAYYLVWYEYYRDQNNYSVSEPLLSDNVSDFEFKRISQLRPRAWEHDYFTSALTTPQRGPQVAFSLFDEDSSGTMSFSGIKFNNGTYKPLARNAEGYLNELIEVRTRGTSYDDIAAVGDVDGVVQDVVQSSANIDFQFNNPASYVQNGKMQGQIDVTGLTMTGNAVTIEQLRQYSRLQEWLELQARCGSRYSEYLRSQWEVISSDARLQRPEYIAGGSVNLTISDVMNQGSEDTGTYAGQGVAASGALDKFSYFCEEDGYIITMMSILPATSYSQGIPRMWTRLNTFDFANVKFAQLGEQPIYGYEICAGIGHDNDTFGYQARYQDYKYIPDTIHGDFRGTYSYWTLSRLFDTSSDVHQQKMPTLSYSFISTVSADDPRSYAQLYRVFRVTDPSVDHFYIDIWHDEYVERKLPEFNVPQL